MKKLIIIGLLIVTAACASAPKPETAPGKASIYGTVKAQSHKDFIKKSQSGNGDNGNEGYGGGSIFGGAIQYTKNMINYNKLSGLYACLIDPEHGEKTLHTLEVGPDGPSPRSLALAPGDSILIRNNASQTHNFFISDEEEGFQAFPPIPAGGEERLTVKLEGLLELGSDEDDSLIVDLLSRKGLVGKRLSSGDSYAFENVDPGSYEVVFWHWRLGWIVHQVTAAAGESIKLDETLSVDRIIHD